VQRSKMENTEEGKNSDATMAFDQPAEEEL